MILVTGGAGFIGSNFILQWLAAQGENVINLDKLTYAGNLRNLDSLRGDVRHIFVRGDIDDAQLVAQLLRQHQPRAVVNFAAESHVDRSILGPAEFVRTNIHGTFNLLEAARAYWFGQTTFARDRVRFHHVSTDEVFGSLKPGDPPFSETTAYMPNSPYSASKASSDHLVRSYYHTYGLPVTISNCTNNYGPYQFPEKLIPLIILNAAEGKPLPIYGDGQQIRDWLYVEDHCEAVYRILKNGRPGETYAVGGNNQPPNLEIVENICAIMDEMQTESAYKPHQSLIKFVADRPGHDRRYAMNINKIQTELGWQPRETLYTGLRRTVAWYLSHPEWVGQIHKQQDYQSWLKQNYDKRGTAGV